MSERLKKLLLIIIVLAYFVSPVDFMPGFLGDDAIMAIGGYLLSNRISKNNDNKKFDSSNE